MGTGTRRKRSGPSAPFECAYLRTHKSAAADSVPVALAQSDLDGRVALVGLNRHSTQTKAGSV